MMNLISKAVLLWILAAGMAGAEGLVNPSFEEQGEQGDRAAGWGRWGNWINRETGWKPVKDGAGVMGYHHWRIENDQTSGLFQDLEGVEPGKMYTFSIYANADAVEAGQQVADMVEVRLETTLEGEQSVVASQQCRVQDLASGEHWSLLRLRTRAPNDVLRVVIVLTPSKKGPRGGAVKFDDARLTVE